MMIKEQLLHWYVAMGRALSRWARYCKLPAPLSHIRQVGIRLKITLLPRMMGGEAENDQWRCRRFAEKDGWCSREGQVAQPRMTGGAAENGQWRCRGFAENDMWHSRE